MPITSDKAIVAKAFRVEINGSFVPVKSYSGGDLTAEKVSGIGRETISDLTIVAYMTPDQNILGEAMNKVANQGKNERFTIKITKLAKDKSVVKKFVYDRCLITSLDFPTMDAHGGEILCETATFKPTTLTVS